MAYTRIPTTADTMAAIANSPAFDEDGGGPETIGRGLGLGFGVVDTSVVVRGG